MEKTAQRIGRQTLRKHKLMFIHIPKNAGRVIMRHLFGPGTQGYWAGRGSPPANSHITADHFNDIKGYGNYTTFCFSRDPYERFVSVYCHNSRPAKEKKNIIHTISVAEAIDMLEENTVQRQTPEGQWIKDDTKLSGHFQPQTYWIGERTEIYRVDNLKKDMITFAKKHGLPKLESRSRKWKARPHGRTALKRRGVVTKLLQKALSTEPHLANKFMDWYRSDFEVLGYKEKDNK
jgi:hypothetical protein